MDISKPFNCLNLFRLNKDMNRVVNSYNQLLLSPTMNEFFPLHFPMVLLYYLYRMFLIFHCADLILNYLLCISHEDGEEFQLIHSLYLEFGHVA